MKDLLKTKCGQNWCVTAVCEQVQEENFEKIEIIFGKEVEKMLTSSPIQVKKGFFRFSPDH